MNSGSFQVLEREVSHSFWNEAKHEILPEENKSSELSHGPLRSTHLPKSLEQSSGLKAQSLNRGRRKSLENFFSLILIFSLLVLI